MNKPLISAIISTYNAEEFIKGRLDNLIEQTIFNDIEIIIINSASKQNEEFIINEYLSKHKNIKYIKTEERETIYKAWNRGLRLATGHFITNANTDDRLKKDALELLVDFISSKPSVAMVYADQYISNIPNQSYVEATKSKRSFRPRFSRLKLFRGYMAGSQSLWRSSIHKKDNIYFDESFEVAGDYDFICRIAEKYEIRKLNKILGVYYKSQNKSNKEDQNLQLTHSEAAKVKDIYCRRFINSLSANRLNRLEIKLKIIALVPGKFWGLINRISINFFPGYFTIDRIYICWVISLIKERKHEIIEAKKIVEKYKDKDESQLIRMQLNNLLKYKI
jgi:glycosyltransferase involved in cell wall biosynthesis